MTGGVHHTNVCKFLNFQPTFFSADITHEILKLCRVSKVKVFFLVLVYDFSAANLVYSARVPDICLGCTHHCLKYKQSILLIFPSV